LLRLGTADVVDLHQALAFPVDLFDEALEVAGEEGLLVEGTDGAQGDLLGLAQGRRGQTGERGGREDGAALSLRGAGTGVDEGPEHVVSIAGFFREARAREGGDKGLDGWDGEADRG